MAVYLWLKLSGKMIIYDTFEEFYEMLESVDPSVKESVYNEFGFEVRVDKYTKFWK